MISAKPICRTRPAFIGNIKCTKLILSFFLILLIACITPSIPTFNSVFALSQEASLRLETGEDLMKAAVIDPTGEYAYLGCNWTPGIIVKIRLSNLTRVGAINDPSVGGVFRAAVIDPTSEYAYFFATGGTLVKIRLSDFTIVDTLSIIGSGDIHTAIIDPNGEFAYFAQRRIIKIRLSDFTHADTLSFESGEGAHSALIDPIGQYAYFSVNPGPLYQTGKIVKVDLSSFTRVASLILSTGEYNLSSALMDPEGEYAYFGTSPFPSKIVKIRLSDFTYVETMLVQELEGGLTSGVIDPEGEYAYFGAASINPSRIIRIRLSDFTHFETLILSGSHAYNLGPAVIDPNGEHAYFVTYTFPSWIIELNLLPDPIDVIVTFDTVPANTGTIVFDGVSFNDDFTVNKSSGTYNINVAPATNYSFTEWETEGNISVADPNIASTSCTILGNGTLRMIQIESKPSDQSFTINFETEPFNTGLLEFDGATYGHGADTVRMVGSYNIKALSDSGYNFDQWETSGGVSVTAGTFNQSITVCTITGNGTLVMLQTPVDMPIPTPNAIIESCDASGNIKNHFDSTEDIFVKGSGFVPNAIYNVYVVIDTEWIDDMQIPTRVPNSVVLVSANETGAIPITGAWSGNVSIDGKYDIVIDYHGNGKYDREADPIDDSDIMITAGFDIPEFSSYLFLPILLTILTVIMIYKRKTIESSVDSNFKDTNFKSGCISIFFARVS